MRKTLKIKNNKQKNENEFDLMKLNKYDRWQLN